MGESKRYEVEKLRILIERYIVNDSDYARNELSSMSIKGEDLIEALNCINTPQKIYQEAINKINSLKENISSSLKGLEKEVKRNLP